MTNSVTDTDGFRSQTALNNLNLIPSEHRVIGTCSLCGGSVTVFHGAYWSTVPPVPSCSTCGAVEAKRLPVIPMEKMPRYEFGDSLNDPKFGDTTFDSAETVFLEHNSFFNSDDLVNINGGIYE